MHYIGLKRVLKRCQENHNLVTTEDPFQNVTMNKMQKEMRGKLNTKTH
jgi:hypothetical protein